MSAVCAEILQLNDTNREKLGMDCLKDPRNVQLVICLETQQKESEPKPLQSKGR